MIFRQSADGHYFMVGFLVGLGKMITYQVTRKAGEALLKAGIKPGDRVPLAAVSYMRSTGLIFTYGSGLSSDINVGRKGWDDSIADRLTQLLAGEAPEMESGDRPPWNGRDLWGTDLEALWAKCGFYGHCFNMLSYRRAKYEKVGDDLIHDAHTGLTWQAGGSKKKFTWFSAVSYVNDLNIQKACGHSDWRLPTLNELATLFRPSMGDFWPHLSDSFQLHTFWCWSSDVFGPSAAWRVNFLNTWAEAVPKTNQYSFAKAVCGGLNK